MILQSGKGFGGVNSRLKQDPPFDDAHQVRRQGQSSS
jgi:hypothetical protein